MLNKQLQRLKKTTFEAFKAAKEAEETKRLVEEAK